MVERGRTLAAALATGGLFALVQIGALAVVQPFAATGFHPPANPSNPITGILYFGAILVATGLMLAAIRLGVDRLIRTVVLLTSTVLTWTVLAVLIARAFPTLPSGLIAAVVAVGLTLLLFVYPEWYVIDTAGVVMGAGAAALFGITVGLLPAISLLVILAVYDAVSVYGTKHMLTLAASAIDLRIPVLFVVPTTLSYSFLDATETGSDQPANRVPDPRSGDIGDRAGADANTGNSPPMTDPPVTKNRTAKNGDPTGVPLDRDALFVGLGDAVMPTILVVSAAFFLPAPRYDLPVLLNLPALGAAGGTMVGLGALQVLVFRGRAHAGLPLLNGGAITGYIVGALAAGVSLVEALGIAPLT